MISFAEPHVNATITEHVKLVRDLNDVTKLQAERIERQNGILAELLTLTRESRDRLGQVHQRLERLEAKVEGKP
jgi:Spy/CpxP family protein refolding chaperone